MITIRETVNIKPVCPHCEEEIRDVLATKLETLLGVRFIYFCGLCKKVLGLSHRKGFWMG